MECSTYRRGIEGETDYSVTLLILTSCYMSAKVQVLVGFDPDQIEWLKAESIRRRVPRAQVIRELVLREMASQPKAPVE